MRNPFALIRLGSHFLKLTRDLNRLNQVFAINDQLMRLKNDQEAEEIIREVRKTPYGPKAFQEKPRLGKLNFQELSSLPPETLGGAYSRWMLERGILAESIPSLADSTDLDYVVAHLYETHDLWHVLTGFDVDPAGEAGLQAFYLAQQRSYLPFFVISAILLNTAIFEQGEKEKRMNAIVRGWNLGKQAKNLFGVPWRSRFEQPLAQVRAEFSLEA